DMDLAHKLSFQLRAAEERLRELSPRRRIIVIAPRAPSNGSCASIMRSSRHSSRKTSGILLTAVSVLRRDPPNSARDKRARVRPPAPTEILRRPPSPAPIHPHPNQPPPAF